MVTRKPVGPSVSTLTVTDPSVQAPPYPTTPTLDRQGTATTGSVYPPEVGTSPAFGSSDMHEARSRSRSDSDASSHIWDSDDDYEDRAEKPTTPDDSDIPKPLRITPTKQSMSRRGSGKNELPAILRVGPAAGAPKQNLMDSQQNEQMAQSNPWEGATVQQPVGIESNSPNIKPHPPVSNNPYRQQNGYEPQNSQTAWQGVAPPAPIQPPPPPPVELPTMRTPSQELSQMSLNGGLPPRQASHAAAEVLSVPTAGSTPTPALAQENGGQPLPMPNPWGEEQSFNQQSGTETDVFSPPAGPPPKAPHVPAAVVHASPPRLDPLPSQSLLELSTPAPRPPVEEPARPAPISIPYSAAARSSESVPETPGTRVQRQKNEHYQLKHVRWLDGPAMRTSPILTQNANGPCPLLALVNALVLSTPPNLNTALVETLRTREQVSLGLLLDAVFDELMSDRRGDATHQLPDVSELYAFLLALHTGMNVNPRFVTPISALRGSSNGRSSHHDYESGRGGFEETKEMRLYSTFGIPLIHGWTTPSNTPTYDAFVRSAQTFEDAQNLQFAEAELEDKLRSHGLTSPEQQTLQDIQSINGFLASWPTQLTQYGLDSISSSLKPGQFAILFRNDHFSTLYKDPKHGALMTLVTDAGYSSHEEIVWESLVDVNGAASELFSGDFRPVSHQQDAGSSQHNSTASYAQSARPSAPSSTSEIPPPLPGPRPQQSAIATSTSSPPDEAQRQAAEQEDHDLALALQLQDEEEDQQRQAEQRRRHEQQLSEQFLSSETSPEGPRPTIPPRRGANHTSPITTTNRPRPTGRPAVNRPTDPTDPEAPPSYEQAANDRPYRPAGSSAPGVQGSPLTAYDALMRQQSAMNSSSSTTINSLSTPPSHNRRRSEGNRIRRQSSQGPNVVPGGGFPAAAAVLQNQQYQHQQQRISNAPRVQDAEERCCVM